MTLIFGNDSRSLAFIFEGSLALSPFNGELVFSGNGRHFMPLLSSLEFQMASNVPSSFDKMSDTTYFFYLPIIFSSSMQLLKMKLSDGFLIFSELCILQAISECFYILLEP